MQSAYSPTSTPQTQTYSQSYGQYSAKPRSASPVRYSPSSPRSQEGSGVTYAQIAPQEDSGVTYAQIAPRSERPIPGPQVPVQIKVSDLRSQPNPDARSPSNMQPSPNQGQGLSRSLPQQSYSPASLPQQSYSPASQQYSVSKLAGQPPGSSKEQEVDDLTKMLMQGLEGTKDPDFFGKMFFNGEFLVFAKDTPYPLFMSHVVRKPVLDHIRHKPGCPATEDV